MPRYKSYNATLTEGGFARVSIGKVTHSVIKAEARERGISQNELIKAAVTAYTGKAIDTKEMIPAERPLASVNLAHIEANTAEAVSGMEALGIVFRRFFSNNQSITQEEYIKIKNSPLHALLDDEVVAKFKKAIAAANDSMPQLSLNGLEEPSGGNKV